MPSAQRKLEMARAHAKYVNHCTCGKNVAGNGGKYQHSQMHKRKGDDHHYMTYSEYERRRALKAAENDEIGARVLAQREPY